MKDMFNNTLKVASTGRKLNIRKPGNLFEGCDNANVILDCSEKADELHNLTIHLVYKSLMCCVSFPSNTEVTIKCAIAEKLTLCVLSVRQTGKRKKTE